MGLVRAPNPLPAALMADARTQEGLVTRAQLLAVGMTSPRMSRAVRDGRLHRVFDSVYDLLPQPFLGRTRDPDHQRDDLFAHRRRRPAWYGLLAHGPSAVAVGQSALVLRDVQGLPVEPLVEVTRLDRRERVVRPGVLLRRYEGARSYDDVGGRLAVPVDLALAQAVPHLDRRHAVAVMDSALHRRLITPDGLHLAHDLARGRRGVERTHDWWGLADRRSESPAETVARLSCLDEGAPPDVLQLRLVTRDGARVRVDMAWWLGDGRWLLVEVDGHDEHSTPEALFRDRRRQNLLAAAGHVVLRYSGSDAWSGVVGPQVTDHLRGTSWRPGRPVPRGPVLLG
ncbi:hypothetical protein [Isoptericola sp. NPDC019482]|uniref:hypothetical protein n=1 Tax=Isoptericola sp. NPDC019482 TaxID=3154688 RepID=UPI0034994C09